MHKPHVFGGLSVTKSMQYLLQSNDVRIKFEASSVQFECEIMFLFNLWGNASDLGKVHWRRNLYTDKQLFTVTVNWKSSYRVAKAKHKEPHESAELTNSTTMQSPLNADWFQYDILLAILLAKYDHSAFVTFKQSRKVQHACKSPASNVLCKNIYS